MLEENQVLMEQLEVQTLKFKDMYKAQETESERFVLLRVYSIHQHQVLCRVAHNATLSTSGDFVCPQ